MKVHLLQEAHVHRRKPSFPKLLVIAKVVGGNGELAVAKPLWPGPFLEVIMLLLPALSPSLPQGF
jgi:hypothetical protein